MSPPPGRPKEGSLPLGGKALRAQGAPSSACGCQGSPALGADHEDAGCSGGEAFALRVLGQSMAPEFSEGEIILIEPDGALRDGAYVLARSEGEYIFRQLLQRDGQWWLHALNPAWPDAPLADLAEVHGVIIQAAVPGRRRLTRHYV